MRTYLFIISSILLWSSCERPPDFDDTPEIDFNSIEKSVIFDPLTLIESDSISITLDFKDGNGDLGFKDDEAGTGKYVGEFANNYHITFFKKVDGSFIDITYEGPDTLDYNGAFPNLAPTNELAPIQGTLTRHLVLPHSIYSPGSPDPAFDKGDTLRFEVYIYDLDLNRSNTITTSEVIFWEEE